MRHRVVYLKHTRRVESSTGPWQRLLAVFRWSRAEDELAGEIDAHLRFLEDGFVSNGMSREEARFAARRAFGGVEQAKEHQRDARSVRWLDDSRIDFKLGARMLAKYPGLSIIGGAGLAVGELCVVLLDDTYFNVGIAYANGC